MQGLFLETRHRPGSVSIDVNRYIHDLLRSVSPENGLPYLDRGGSYYLYTPALVTKQRLTHDCYRLIKVTDLNGGWRKLY